MTLLRYYEMLAIRKRISRFLSPNKYSKVVEACLTCLDKDNVDFGDEDEFADGDGVVVGVRYIEKVLGALDQVSMVRLDLL